MDLFEYQGKELFANFGIPTPQGTVIRTLADVDKFPSKADVEYVVKAQVQIGGRGKLGGVRFGFKNDLPKLCKDMLGMDIKGFKANELLIVEKIPIEKEMYMSLTLNRSDRNITLIFSEQGGMDIEQLAQTQPEKIVKVGLVHFDAVEQKAVKDAFVKSPYATELFSFVEKLFKIVKEKDAMLVEINPLAVSKGYLVAADAKVSLDENALYRHPEYDSQQKVAQSAIEQKAAGYDLQYVELDGTVAIIGNGAGLVMATLDVVNHFGGSAANFLDIGGGASVEKMEQALEVVLMKKGVSGVFINIFGGITKCDDIAQGLVNYIGRKKIHVPMVVRMTGTHDKEGKEILRRNKIESFDSMDECAKKICSLVKI